jgi:SAM-dependent methyltransferase
MDVESKSHQVELLNADHFNSRSSRQFLEGSPHLNHSVLRSLSLKLADQAMPSEREGRDSVTVLDLGAGEGALSEYYLSLGCKVTAVDVSDQLLDRLREKCAPLPGELKIVNSDVNRVLSDASGERFDIICACSFLHHIPDYSDLCAQAYGRLKDGGCFYTFQDPLIYKTLPKTAHLLQKVGYYWWRLFRGNYRRGIRTLIRRLRGEYRDDLLEDMAEFHVVRGGVDAEGIKAEWEKWGGKCEIVRYWSAHSCFFQGLGGKLDYQNYFGLLARRTMQSHE